ncbi:MAG: LLM class flavin-dependent oxidoreductase [Chloroflexota bacterium]|nr:LLM class flavin-dependent oxidoreductase [Chloroflexota bacterium]
MTRNPAIGVMFVREYKPATIPDYARMVERTGLDDLWIVEDAFFNGGISAASVALAVTERITVGIGILPAVVRNAAYTAMDLATLAQIFPGRLQIGFGHGVADWIRQVGAFPTSQMAALEDVTTAVRRLLRGDEVTMHGRHVHLDRVRLDHRPDFVPPVSLGVTGPKSMELSGRVADGTIMVELTGPALVRHHLERIQAGAAAVGRSQEPHQITVFAYWMQDDNGDRARERIRPNLARRVNPEGLRDLAVPGFADQARAWIDEGGTDLLADRMPREWIDEIAVAGTPADCAAAIDRLAAAGANRIGLVPPAGMSIAEVERWSRDLVAARS